MERQHLVRPLVVLSMVAVTTGCANVAPSVSTSPSTHASPRPAASPTTRAIASTSPSARPLPSPAPASPRATLAPGGVTELLAPDRSFRIVTSLGWKQREVEPPALSATIGGSSASSGRRLTLLASRGRADGTIGTCRTPADYWETCRTIHARSLDELVAGFDTRLLGHRRELQLDGEPAVVLEYQAQERPARGIQALAYILAMHFGRPYAVRLWSSTEIAIGRVDDVVAGFRFLTPDPALLDVHFTMDGSAKLQLPGRWVRTGGPDERVASFSDGQRRLSIRDGDDVGRIKTCDAAIGFSEQCSDVRLETLDELVEAVGGSGLSGMVHETAALDGEPAAILRPGPDGSSTVDVPVAYVLSMHRGRPWIIQLVGRQPGSALTGLEDIMTGFSFLDPAVPAG
jgi:hypothetical protein